jgi:hypothetical protein
MPSLLTGTGDQLPLLHLLSRLCCVVGVSWENEAFVNQDDKVKAYIAVLVMLTGTRLGLVTWNAIPLNHKASVGRHTDKENCPQESGLSEVVIVQKVLDDDSGG